MIQTTIGKKLKKFRDEQGLSQEEMGAELHISTSSIGKMERGEMDNPTLNTIKDIARMIGTTEWELISPDEKMTLLPKEELEILEFREYKNAWNKLPDDDKSRSLKIVRLALKMD